MARAHDLQENAAKMLIAFLDIYHGLLETLTPKYANYKLQGLNAMPLHGIVGFVRAVQPPAVGNALSQGLVLKSTWGHIDMDAVLSNNRATLTREMLVDGIGQLESGGQLKVVADGVHQCYRVLALPKDINALAAIEYVRFLEREARELARLEQVVDFVTAEDGRCQSLILMKNFGEVPPRGWKCNGACRNCRKGEKVERKPRSNCEAVPGDLWKRVERAVQSNALGTDDPRHIARFAIGTRSPRVAKEKLAGHEAFGCLGKCGCSFKAILAKCEKLCGRTDSSV